MGGRSKSKQSSSSQNVNSNQGVNSGVGINYGINQSGNFGMNQGSSQNSGFSQNASSSAGGSQNTSQSTQDVWGNQAGYLDDVYGQAQNAFQQGMSQIEGLTPEVQAQLTDSFRQASGGFGDQLGGGFAAGLQGQIGPNSYVDALKGDIARDAQNLKQQNLGSLDSRAAAAGMSGSSGYRDQVNDMANNIDENALSQMSQLGFNAHNQGVQNQMNLAGMMDQNQQAGLGNLQNMQQGAMAQFNPAMLGQQMASQYAQTIGGPTVLGNSSSQGTSFNNANSQGTSFNQGTSNNMGMNTGFSNGMNIGMNQTGGFNNAFGYGASNGSGSSSGWSFDPGATMAGASKLYGSDARLKKNIKHVDQINGVNLYTWDWKDDAPVTSPMNYGVIAQEVVQTHPEAVLTGEHGYMMVDYSKLGRAGEVALARMEG